MSSLTHYCYRCYGENRTPQGRCAHCVQPIEPPPGTTFPELLVWALGHPVAPVAMQAAATLGAREECSAAGPLRTLVESPDPFLSAEALRALVAIEGAETLRPLLERLEDEGSLPVRRAAARWLQQRE